MKLLHLLSLTLLTTLSAQAGYFPSFTLINKDQILTPKSIAIVAGGLGIMGLGYYMNDLLKVSAALCQGDEAIAALKDNEITSVIKSLQTNKYNSQLQTYYYQKCLVIPENTLRGHMLFRPNIFKNCIKSFENESNKKLVESTIESDIECIDSLLRICDNQYADSLLQTRNSLLEVEEFQNKYFPLSQQQFAKVLVERTNPRKDFISATKSEFKWRAATDVSIVAAIGAVSYGAYTLINK